MKRLFTVLLSLILGIAMLTFAACADTSPNAPSDGNGQTGGNNESGNNESGDNGDNESGGTTEPQSPATSGDPASDTLVVYFSWSGNTQEMADYIAGQTGAYLVEILPEEPYEGSYNDVAYGRAQEEAETNARPAVSQATYDLIDMQKYDTVIVGYPIWWHTAPMVIGTFLEHYDWTVADNIYPFFQGASNSNQEYYDNSMSFVRGCASGATVHDGLYCDEGATQTIDEYLAENGLSGGTSEAPEEPQEPVDEATQSLTYERYEEGYAVTGVGDETVVVIPSEYEGLPVVAISNVDEYGNENGAFYNKRITEITIPDSVRAIGRNTFYGCQELTTVYIGENSALTSIGSRAFSGCGALEEIYIPSGVSSVGDSAFNNCGSMNFTVAQDNPVYRSGNDHLIENATDTLIRGGQNGTIPDGVEVIGEGAFRRAALEEITIPVSVTEICNYAFGTDSTERIVFEGTEEQWNAITKQSSWNSGNGDVQIVFSDTAEDETDILVVYFSATGNTERVADYIAEATGGDLFELVPVDPYTDDDLDWTNDESRVSEEHENENLRDVELTDTTVDDWAEYDVVFIGYPIWWGIAAWPVNGFVENNDFTGKTVIPFCTSASSPLGQSGALLEELAGTGNWQEGHRFRSGATENDVISWVGSLNIL